MKGHLQKQLQDIGLSEKEAKVYLSSLKIGAAPVQKIAEKAEVKRVTTYVMVKSLMSKGFMPSFQKGKKTLFFWRAQRA